MILKNDLLAKFGPIWGASGVQGFFGEGYWYNNVIPWLNFKGATFVAKTTTIDANVGNMPLQGNSISPKELFPKCIYVSPRSWIYGSALNAVGLSGPGMDFLISRCDWQNITKPFFISIMAVKLKEDDRRIEMWRFHEKLLSLLKTNPHLQSTLGLQINYSCPNTGHNMDELLARLVEEVHDHLSIFRTLGIPLVPKINIILPVEKALEIGNDPNCAGLTLSNTIPWGDLPKLGIDRKKIFGSEESPLLTRGFKQAGGYSGKFVFPFVTKYVKDLRKTGFVKHINAGGGILSSKDVRLLHIAGADSVSLGSVAFLRPWRVQSIIKKAYQLKVNA